MRSLLIVIAVALPAFAIELPDDVRVANRGPMCVWASLETLGKLHGVEELNGLRDYRYTKRGSEPAYDHVIKAELDRRGVEYKLTKQYSYDRKLLEQYANSHGVMVAFKAGSGWSVFCHAVTVISYDAERVEFYCSDKRLKNGVPGMWKASRRWFDQAWLGGAVVIGRSDDPDFSSNKTTLPTAISPASLVSASDAPQSASIQPVLFAECAEIGDFVFKPIGIGHKTRRAVGLNWRSERLLDGPPGIEPVLQNLLFRAEHISPVLLAHCCSVESKQSATSRVSGLFKVSSPDAISRFIVSVDVFTFDRMSIGWLRTHVVVERLKAISPPLADRDSTAAIFCVPIILRVAASLDYVLPRTVLGSCSAPVLEIGSRLSLKTSTRPADSSNQRVFKNWPLSSAFAHAQPSAEWLLVLSDSDAIRRCGYGPSLECTSDQGFGGRRRDATISGNHETILSLEGDLWPEPADVQPSVRLVSFYGHSAAFGTPVLKPDVSIETTEGN